MNYYTFRVDNLESVNTKEIIADFLLKYERYIVFEEIADKTGKLHYQGIVYSDQKSNTYRTYANKHFELWKGGQRRSFADVKDLQKYMSYIYKGGNVAFRNGVSDEEYNDYCEKSSKVNNEIQERKKKRDVQNFTQKYLSYMDEKKVCGDQTYPKYKESIRDKIIELTVSFFLVNTKIWDKFIIRRFVNLYESRLFLGDDRWKLGIINSIKSEMHDPTFY